MAIASRNNRVTKCYYGISAQKTNVGVLMQLT